ncbi:hypothetical protein GQ42DRAFT_6634, partial [Ramicandelaber brevisporus]
AGHYDEHEQHDEHDQHEQHEQHDQHEDHEHEEGELTEEQTRTVAFEELDLAQQRTIEALMLQIQANQAELEVAQMHDVGLEDGEYLHADEGEDGNGGGGGDGDGDDGQAGGAHSNIEILAEYTLYQDAPYQTGDYGLEGALPDGDAVAAMLESVAQSATPEYADDLHHLAQATAGAADSSGDAAADAVAAAAAAAAAAMAATEVTIDGHHQGDMDFDMLLKMQSDLEAAASTYNAVYYGAQAGVEHVDGDGGVVYYEGDMDGADGSFYYYEGDDSAMQVELDDAGMYVHYQDEAGEPQHDGQPQHGAQPPAKKPRKPRKKKTGDDAAATAGEGEADGGAAAATAAQKKKRKKKAAAAAGADGAGGADTLASGEHADGAKKSRKRKRASEASTSALQPAEAGVMANEDLAQYQRPLTDLDEAMLPPELAGVLSETT